MAIDDRDDGFGEGRESHDGGDPVVVASAEPLRMRIRKVEHPSIPEEALGIGTYLGPNLLGRQAVAPETLPLYRALLTRPRRLVYVAYEKEDGSIEGQLAAMVSPSEVVDGAGAKEPEDEPWKSSVPSWNPPGSGSTQEGGPGEEGQVALLPLGLLVRIAARRSHPDDLTAEAAELLRSVVREGTVEIVDQFLDTI